MLSSDPHVSNRSAKTFSRSGISASWASMRAVMRSLTMKSSAPATRASSTSRMSSTSVSTLIRLAISGCSWRNFRNWSRVMRARASASSAVRPLR